MFNMYDRPSLQKKKRNRDKGCPWRIPLLGDIRPNGWSLIRKVKEAEDTHIIIQVIVC